MDFELYLRNEPDDVEEGDGVTVTVKYGFQGCNSYSQLRTYALQLTPVTIPFNGRILGRRSWRPRFQPGEWGYVDIEYSSNTTAEQAIQPEGPPGEPPTPPSMATPTDDDSLGANWTFSTRGGTINAKLSKKRVSGTGRGLYAVPDYGKLIGVTASGIRGVDVPLMKFTASITIPTDLKLPLIRELARIDEPHTNSQPWLGMAAGEWLYVGAEGNGDQSGRGSITIHLEGGRNMTAGDPGLVIEDGILTLPAKKAHEYVDVYYEPAQIGDFVLQRAAWAIVHQMWDEMSFSAVFGFG